MTRIKETLNLAFHGVKTSERSELFRDVADWLLEMADADPVSVAALRSRDLVEQLEDIEGPCDCSNAICEHWKSEAQIILTVALRLPNPATAYQSGLSSARSLCVKRVELMRDEWETKAGWNWGTQVGTANKIIEALQSLTLQEQEAKQ